MDPHWCWTVPMIVGSTFPDLNEILDSTVGTAQWKQCAGPSADIGRHSYDFSFSKPALSTPSNTTWYHHLFSTRAMGKCSQFPLRFSWAMGCVPTGSVPYCMAEQHMIDTRILHWRLLSMTLMTRKDMLWHEVTCQANMRKYDSLGICCLSARVRYYWQDRSKVI